MADTDSSFAAQGETAPQPYSLRGALRQIGWLDWLMLLLAAVSVGLLTYGIWGPASVAERLWIIRADRLICAAFAGEFLWRWRKAGWSCAHLLHGWYDILGMLPVSQPALRAFRLFRAARIAILLLRSGMPADRALGAEFTWRVVDRFKDEIVDAISGPIAAAVLDEVADVLKKGTYTHNIARALDENHRELRAMITDKLRADPRAGRLKRLPFYDDIVATVVDASLDLVQEILRDPRTNALVADMLKENITQLREAVERNQE